MRKHSPRKWLHAILDLLPVIIIPIFAIYSHRHTIDSYEVTRDKYQVVDFNQRLPNGDFKNQNEPNAYHYVEYTNIVINNNCETIIIDNNASWFYQYGTYRQIDDFAILGHKYVVIQHISSSKFNTYGSDTFGSGASYTELDTNIFGLYWECNGVTRNIFIYPITNQASDIQINDSYTIYSTYVTDLTQMYGSGNEPTLSEYYSQFPNDYYDYTTSKKVLIQNGTETLNNTDIGSQFVYALYTPIHDYFNLTQVGVFGDLYNWLQLNMFNGTAPISIFIVYHVILYEFIMDLIFLIYCVFMFVIDFTERLLDSLFDKSFGGGK